MTQDTHMTDAAAPEALSAQPDPLKQKRKKAFLLLFVLLAIIAIAYWFWTLCFNNTVTTDNAYVGAENAIITSMVSGQVAEVLVSDTQTVQKDQVLLKINPKDAEIALQQAQAELFKAQRQYKQTSANSHALNSQVFVSSDAIASSQAQLEKAQADLNKAQADLARRQALDASGAISKEELATAATAVSTAQANYHLAQANLAQAKSSQKAAQSNLAANEALIQGVDAGDTPDVMVAKAKLAQALLDLERTEIKAPFAGVIARRNIQVGQRVTPGNSLMTVVPVDRLYVDANFKESQLAKVKAGQKAVLTSDLYGKKVEYHGTVVGFSGGTGSAFALIPAQNATGNWIKVVQRLPVRIQLDPKELAAHPLRVGLSMEASIQIEN